MKIETKFNIGDIVYWLNKNNYKIEKFEITQINTCFYSNCTESIEYVGYTKNHSGTEYESNLYKTKEELISNLLRDEE